MSAMVLADWIGDVERGWRWQTKAACLGVSPDVFFVTKGKPVTEAKRYCRRCPVRTMCLAGALARREWDGVWAGLSEKQRRPLIRKLNAGVAIEDLELPFLGQRCRECRDERRRSCAWCKRTNSAVIAVYNRCLARAALAEAA